jgi:hypothetical protein
MIFHTKYPKKKFKSAPSLTWNPGFAPGSDSVIFFFTLILLQCKTSLSVGISSTLYSLTSINCVVTVRGVANCRNLTDGRTEGHQVFEQRA